MRITLCMAKCILLVFQELSYPDGKVEQIFLDGRRTVVFGNGTRKHQFPDGHTAIRFTNKDIKRFYPCGKLTNCSRPAQPLLTVVGHLS